MSPAPGERALSVLNWHQTLNKVYKYTLEKETTKSTKKQTYMTKASYPKSSQAPSLPRPLLEIHPHQCHVEYHHGLAQGWPPPPSGKRPVIAPKENPWQPSSQYLWCEKRPRYCRWSTVNTYKALGRCLLWRRSYGSRRWWWRFTELHSSYVTKSLVEL